MFVFAHARTHKHMCALTHARAHVRARARSRAWRSYFYLYSRMCARTHKTNMTGRVEEARRPASRGVIFPVKLSFAAGAPFCWFRTTLLHASVRLLG